MPYGIGEGLSRRGLAHGNSRPILIVSAKNMFASVYCMNTWPFHQRACRTGKECFLMLETQAHLQIVETGPKQLRPIGKQ